MTIARILAEKGADIVTITPERTLDEAIHLLAEKRIGALVVTHGDGSVAGILSERDVVRAIAARGATALDDAVSQFMTKTVVTTDEDQSVIDVVRAMSAGRFRHMPVVVEGRIVGIVSVGDAIKYRLEQMEAEQSALREYIATA